MQSYFFDTFRIGYSENNGAFLGLGSTLPEDTRFWIFTFSVGIILLGLFVYLLKSRKLTVIDLTAFSLFLGGGVSNFYDRATNNGAVIDFLNIGLGSLRTGIFNVADMAIMLGAGILLFVSFKQTKKESKLAS
jgi:signal peptidase II